MLAMEAWTIMPKEEEALRMLDMERLYHHKHIWEANLEETRWALLIQEEIKEQCHHRT